MAGRGGDPGNEVEGKAGQTTSPGESLLFSNSDVGTLTSPTTYYYYYLLSLLSSKFLCFTLIHLHLSPSASWRMGPPRVLSIDSCLGLQCASLSRTATLLWTSPFLLCAARLFLAGLSFSFPLGSMSGL